MLRRRPIPLHCFADFAAAVAMLLIFLLAALWMRSHASGGDEFFYDGPGATLQFCSRDGRVMVGVGPRPSNRMWGRLVLSRRILPLSDIINHPDRYISLTPFRAAVAVPHVLLAGVIGIVPAWWWVVYRHRLEENRRRVHGLCASCGYDLRAATSRCPECGTDIGTTKLDRPHADLSVAIAGLSESSGSAPGREPSPRS